MVARTLKPGSAAAALEEQMVEAITAEIRRPRGKRRAPGAPDVYEDTGGFPKSYHYFVVWDEFEGLTKDVRSKVILKAVRSALGRERAIQTTISWGLTREEAKEMGLVRA